MIFYKKEVILSVIAINATILGFMLESVLVKIVSSETLMIGDYAKVTAPIFTLLALLYELFINKERHKS